MKRYILLLLMIFTSSTYAIEPFFMDDPAISPDGKEVCFVYFGDLWSVPFDGGEAKRLTVSNGKCWNPAYSPDGKNIAFSSNRDGWGQIFLIPKEGGIAKSICSENLSLANWYDEDTVLAIGSEPGFGNKFYLVKTNGDYQEITQIGGVYSTVSQDKNKIVFAHRGDPFR